MPGSALSSENASASSSSKTSGARGRFSSHHSAARSMCACARFVTRTSTVSQPRRRASLASTSWAETVSPRSASAIERSSSASSSADRVKPPSSSLARTVTDAPSSSVTPSTTTLPPTTFPVAIFIVRRILQSTIRRGLAPNVEACGERARRVEMPRRFHPPAPLASYAACTSTSSLVDVGAGIVCPSCLRPSMWNSMASRTRERTSSFVSAAAMQPGRSGTCAP